MKKGPRAKVINLLGLNQFWNRFWCCLEYESRMPLGPRRFACKQRLSPVSKMIQSKKIYHHWLSITSEKFALICTRMIRYQMARDTVFRESWIIGILANATLGLHVRQYQKKFQRSFSPSKCITLSIFAVQKNWTTCVLAWECPRWRETRLSGNPGFAAISAKAILQAKPVAKKHTR